MNVQKVEEDGLVKREAMKKAISSGESLVQKFYEDSVVFLTGGSGFLGKHLIQKLLSSTNVKKIYVLIRSKREKTIEERLKHILEDPVYESLREEQPHFVNKLVPVEGDSADENLGLNEKNWSMIADEVNVIYHAAATINFKEEIKTATLTNIRSAREILKLAKASKNIKAVVHVSTAYVHATENHHNDILREDFYECPISPDVMITLANTMEKEKLERMMEPVMKEWPNSYTFTKALAEELIRTESGDLPICIVRPAIVIAAYRDPKPGWIDANNIFGPSGLIIGITLGGVHALLAKDEAILDYVPVDVVNNALIASAWETFERFKRGNRQKTIYTVTGTDNPLKYKDIDRILHTAELKELMPSNTMWYAFGVVTQYKSLHLFLTWLLHYIPGFLIDAGSMLVGKKPRFLKTYKMAYGLTLVFAHFLNNTWTFEGKNTSSLYNKLSETDRTIYNCEMTTIVDKEDMFFTWCYGMHKYLLKDTGDREYAKRRMFYFKILHYIVFPIYLYCLYKAVRILLAFLFSLLYKFSEVFLLDFIKC